MSYRKWSTILGVIGVVFLFYLFSSNSNTTAAITVLKKGYSEDKKEAYIITAPPNSSNEEAYKNKILVKEPMVWNLIERGRVYTVNYDSRKNEKILKQIHLFGDDKAIE